MQLVLSMLWWFLSDYMLFVTNASGWGARAETEVCMITFDILRLSFDLLYCASHKVSLPLNFKDVLLQRPTR